MSNFRTGLLNLLLRQTRSDAHLERRLRLPLLFSRAGSELGGHGFETRNKDTTSQTLSSLASVPYPTLAAFGDRQTYIVYNFLHNHLLIPICQALRLNMFVLDNQQQNRVLRHATTPHPITPRIQLFPHGLDIFPQLSNQLRPLLHHPNCATRSHGKNGRKGGRVRIGGGCDALVLDDLIGACAEAATCAERTRERADDHVDFVWVDGLEVCQAGATRAEDAVGKGFIEDETELVAQF